MNDCNVSPEAENNELYNLSNEVLEEMEKKTREKLFKIQEELRRRRIIKVNDDFSKLTSEQIAWLFENSPRRKEGSSFLPEPDRPGQNLEDGNGDYKSLFLSGKF